MKDYHYADGLESERLITRFITAADVQVWKPFFGDKECTRFIPDFGLKTSDERAQHWVDRQLKRYADKRYGLQLLADKQTGEIIGQCGLMTQDVDGTEELEVGYHFLRQHWGKGYATEAAQLFRNYGFSKGLVDSIVSIIDVSNVPSQRVAERNGMKRGKQTKWMEMDIFVYRIQREDWAKLAGSSG